VVTMASGSSCGPEKLFALESHVQRLNGDARFVVTDFQPVPLRDVRGRAVYLTTTAPEEVAARQVAHLESTFGCRVVGHSSHLADRVALGEDMERADRYEVLLTELKAAAVDVAANRATARGAEVVFVDNRPVTVSEGPDLGTLLKETFDRATARHARRGE
jgi:cyclic 2,3-diphosphoglycerate synthetase